MARYRLIPTMIMILLVVLTSFSKAQLIDKKTISLDLSKKIAAVAEAEAAKNNWNVAIAIVDDGGNLIYFCKMDNTQNGSIEVSIQKAKSSIQFKRATKIFEDMIAAGRTAILSLPGALPIEGGVPLVVNSQFVGAIGISGAKSSEDGIVAKAASDFLNNMFNETR